MHQSTILKIIILLGNLSVGIAAATFLVTDKQRHDSKIIQSWQVINSASGKSSNGGMKKALEFLNSNRKSPYDRGQRRFPVFWKHWTPQALNHLDVPNIYLRGIKLPGAFLDEANFQNTDLGYANLKRANPKDANLQEAILESSNLQESFLLNTNLQKSTFQNANLIGATLLSANLKNANLSGSDFAELLCN